MVAVPNPPEEKDAAPTLFDYDIFISYRRGDGRGVASWLWQRMQSYRLPPKLSQGRLPIKAYLDTAFERASEDFWAKNIEPALRRSRYLIVVVTPSVFEPRNDGEQSWVEREIATFLSLPHGRNILVATANGSPIDRLPAVFRREFPRIDVVDLNAFGGRWSFTKRAYLNDQALTLIAPIYGIADKDMPVLRQEEERRKRRAATGVVSGALALVALLMALLIFAVAQRQRAEVRRVQAVKAQKDAEAQKASAVAAREAERLQRVEAERQRRTAEEQRERAERARTAAEARSLGLSALRDFDSGRQIQALMEAVQGGRNLESLVGRGDSFSRYLVVDPYFALNRVLDRIRERNRLEHRGDSSQVQRASGPASAERCPEAARANLENIMGQRGRILAKGCTLDRRFLVTTATDGTVRMVDTTGEHQPELIGLQGAATHLDFSPDSLHFTTRDVWGTIVTWDLSGANSGRSTAVLSGHKSVVTVISFARDISLVATGSKDGEIRLWSTSGRQLGGPIPTGNGPIVALQLSPDGKHILSVTGDGVVQRWDRSGKPASTSVHLGSNIIHAEFAANGLAVAAAFAGGEALVFDLVTGKSVSIRGKHTGWIMSVAFDPGATIVATAGADDTVGVSHLSGEPLGASIHAGQGQVMSVDFSRDGNMLATGGDDGTVRLWSLSGKATGKLVGHESKVLEVRFSPDGQLIATAGSDGTVRLWLPSGEQADQFEGFRGVLAEEALGGGFGTAAISFSPDSRNIAIANSDGSVRVWHIQSLHELLERACAWLGPYFAEHQDERRLCDGLPPPVRRGQYPSSASTF